jgi:hypothetical protein
MPSVNERGSIRKHNSNPKGERYMFHERVLRDQKNLTKYALALAGYVLHQLRIADGGTFRLSLRDAERYLGIKRSHLQAARDLLAERGHWIPIAEIAGARGYRNKPGLFTFGGGPSTGATSTEKESNREKAIKSEVLNSDLRSIAYQETKNSQTKDPKTEDNSMPVLPLVRVVKGGRQ